jgi:hypothetical protein
MLLKSFPNPHLHFRNLSRKLFDVIDPYDLEISRWAPLLFP